MQDALKAAWRELVDFFQPHPKPSEAFYAAWVTEMRRYDLVDVREAIKHLQTHNNRFPSLVEMLATTDSIASNKRESEARRRQQREKAEAEAFWSGDAADDYGKKALRLIKLHLSGVTTRVEFLEGMREMGMSEEADNLHRHYARKGWEMP